ncbi:MAG: hypothetical protein ACOC7O_02900 [Thermoplasmatota archaeon]
MSEDIISEYVGDQQEEMKDAPNLYKILKEIPRFPDYITEMDKKKLLQCCVVFLDKKWTPSVVDDFFEEIEDPKIFEMYKAKCISNIYKKR